MLKKILLLITIFYFSNRFSLQFMNNKILQNFLWNLKITTKILHCCQKLLMEYLLKRLTCYVENVLILARAFLLFRFLPFRYEFVCMYVWEDLSDSEVLPTPFVWLDKSSCVLLLISIEHMSVSVNRIFEHLFVFVW